MKNQVAKLGCSQVHSHFFAAFFQAIWERMPFFVAGAEETGRTPTLVGSGVKVSDEVDTMGRRGAGPIGQGTIARPMTPLPRRLPERECHGNAR